MTDAAAPATPSSLPPAALGRVERVNILFEVTTTARGKPTGIDKRPVPGAVEVGRLGLTGDKQLDRKHHGGPDKAVYVYAAEDLVWWAVQLGRDLTPGLFGENLTTCGLDVTGSVIGDQWTVGEGGLVLEVTMPRTPCATFSHRMGEPRWVRRFTEAARPGAYLRVVQAGTVVEGDGIVVSRRPGHGVRLVDIFPKPRPDVVERLVAAHDDGELTLAPKVRERAARPGIHAPS